MMPDDALPRALANADPWVAHLIRALTNRSSSPDVSMSTRAGTGVYGDYSPFWNSIRLASNVPNDDIGQTLLHELLHYATSDPHAFANDPQVKMFANLKSPWMSGDSDPTVLHSLIYNLQRRKGPDDSTYGPRFTGDKSRDAESIQADELMSVLLNDLVRGAK